ncbi:hypothetical protein EES41_36300 [Streptomyces sp. ADI95-16]|uniref:hypothetical protein n=1 Tax=Streptomyces sp. ADI95-16 TaxID=1522758 RepID=UPI000F42F0DA|nr:hypothetical protein [Streptomyces sp. ADI95-16]AYV32221.1 hypothetical protein EES41_36300 [Streptomyces sp. ADI95-16]
MTTRRTRSAVHRRIFTATTAAVLTATALLTGCSKDDKAADPAPAPPSPSASPSPSADPQAAEKSKVLAVYDAFWGEAVKAYEAGTEKDTKLVNYASKDALNQTLTDIASMQRAGTAMKGTPGHLAEVSALNMSGERPTATISDCFDLSTWKITDRASGQAKPFPTEQPMRYITEFDAELQGGQWMLTKFVRHGDRTC